MSLPSVSSHAKEYGLIAKKALGQNFLFDSNITDKIARGAGVIEGGDVLEIGPGPGGLTRSILKANPRKLVVIEKDHRCLELLQDVKREYPNLEIIEGDALRQRVAELDLYKPKIIANLPYNIATELLFNWIDEIEGITSMTLMFQKEVAERICADETNKKYGKLSIMVALHANAHKLFDVPPQAFTPPPKVTSSVVHITPKDILPHHILVKKIGEITTEAFANRRKMLRTSLAKFITPQDLEKKLKIPSTLRAENLSLDDYIKIAEFVL